MLFVLCHCWSWGFGWSMPTHTNVIIAGLVHRVVLVCIASTGSGLAVLPAS